MRILLSGGGTMGSVSPLLAVAEILKKRGEKIDFLWLGTETGPERPLVESRGLKFRPVFWGKLRRYFDWRNFVAPIFILLGFFQALLEIVRFKPDIILTAGSFVSVPAVWAGRILGVPSMIHQQDIRIGLANKLMLPFASKVTVVFEDSAKLFLSGKAVWTGNPVRANLQLTTDNLQREAREFFGFRENLPTILFVGGGTGALGLNKIIIQALPELLEFCHVIHLTGKDKSYKLQATSYKLSQRYRAYEFLDKEMAYAYALADLVVSRAGMGTFAELAVLGKPAIIVPMPDSHQEANAEFFRRNGAAVVLSQKNLTPEKLATEIRETLQNKDKSENLKNGIRKLIPPNAEEAIAAEIFKLLKK